jgi:hypothetical protein
VLTLPEQPAATSQIAPAQRTVALVVARHKPNRCMVASD